MNAICVENLTKRYGANEVLKGVNLKVDEGEFYALMGPNGSGKTTLASIIALTSYAMAGDKEKLLAAGFSSYMAKPIDVKTFIVEIEKYS